MKITYISNSCLVVEHGKVCIVIDPWFMGSAYMGHWHLFPKPVDLSILERATHLIATHGHEDHLHPESIQQLRKDIPLLFPYLWYESVVPFATELGFSDIQEVRSGKIIQLSNDVKVCFYTIGLDSIVVVQCGGEVLVNLNDALSTHDMGPVKHFAKLIAKNWPTINYLFCGHGGAGTFPNLVHHPAKNDIEIGAVREQLLSHRFCEMMEIFQPQYALPSVAGFVLLKNEHRWINEVRFPREKLQTYARKYVNPNSKISYLVSYPGDTIEKGAIVQRSPYHDLKDEQHSLTHLIDQTFTAEIAQANRQSDCSEQDLQTYIELLSYSLPKRASLMKGITGGYSFDIHPANSNQLIQVNVDAAGGLRIAVESVGNPNAWLTVHASIDALLWSLQHTWGGDVLTIGYGCEVYIHKEEAVEHNLDIVVFSLLTRYPSAKANLKRSPIRSLNYYLQNQHLAHLMIQKKLTQGKLSKHNARSHWINRTKCEVCRICDIPLLENQGLS